MAELGTPLLYPGTVTLLSCRETVLSSSKLAHCRDFSYTRWSKNKRHLIKGMGATANARTTPCAQVFKSSALTRAWIQTKGPVTQKRLLSILCLRCGFDKPPLTTVKTAALAIASSRE